MKRWLCYVAFSFLIVFSFGMVVQASSCDSQDIARLKAIAKNVEVQYEFLSDSDLANHYQVSVSGLADELLLMDERYNKYTVADLKDGEFIFDTTASEVVLKVFSLNCETANVLRTISIELPRFNYYSLTDECKKLKDKNLNICDEWYQGEIDESVFFETVSNYLDEDNGLKQILDKYYYFIIAGALLLVVVLIIFIIVHKRRSVLE